MKWPGAGRSTGRVGAALSVLAVAMVVACGALWPSTALAGRRPFIWAYDTEVLPERGVELENWVTDRAYRNAGDITSIWTAPVVGISDRLELALPFLWSQGQVKSSSQIDWYGAELRWRLRSPDPVEARGWAPLVRLAAHKSMNDRGNLTLEGDAVFGWDILPELHGVLDLGAVGDVQGKALQLNGSLGLSYAVTSDIRLGAEAFAFRFSTAGSPLRLLAGPNVGWTHGRFWLTAGYLAGLTDASATSMLRAMWAIAF